jgi:hypothetical protein
MIVLCSRLLWGARGTRQMPRANYTMKDEQVEEGTHKKQQTRQSTKKRLLRVSAGVPKIKETERAIGTD